MIMQLFGRGVRLKGIDNSLKRSNISPSIPLPQEQLSALKLLETLRIFGVRAKYMGNFKKSLQQEDIAIGLVEIEVPIHIEPFLADKQLLRPFHENKHTK